MLSKIFLRLFIFLGLSVSLIFGDADNDDKYKKKSGYLFIKSLVNDTHGLVDSTRANHLTTVYKNALAATAFTHQKDYELAEGVFSFFQNYYYDNYSPDPEMFPGFRQWWDSQTGLPDTSSDYWEGDNAFLLAALNYYRKETKDPDAFNVLGTALKDWLLKRGNHDPTWYWDHGLNAEGLSDMYASLLPYRDESADIPEILGKIKTGFFIDYNGELVLDHLHRAALVFGYVNDFKNQNLEENFKRSEVWQYDSSVTVTAYAAFESESFINLEISAQILNAWKIWRKDLDLDLSGLQKELEKTWLEDGDGGGLPYLLSYVPGPGGHGWDGCYEDPILDSTCYMIFTDWKFNLLAPGSQAAELMQATDRLEAERCYGYQGVQINAADVSHIDGGDWIRYKKIDFGAGGITSFKAFLCKGNDIAGSMEIRLNSITGRVIGTLTPTQTCDDWSVWEEQSTTVSSVKHDHDLYLTFTGGSGVCNIDWFQFE